MDTRIYTANIKVLLKPIRFNRSPTGRIGIDTPVDFVLDQDRWFSFDVSGSADHPITLTVEHYGKTNSDTDLIHNLDTAIIIDKIELNTISNKIFADQGIYTPTYPKHYLDQNPQASASLSPCTYLGWNGRWQLNLTLPIYTWIHKVEDLGWIYD